MAGACNHAASRAPHHPARLFPAWRAADTARLPALRTLYADDAGRFERAGEALEGAIEVRPTGSRPLLFPLMLDRIAGDAAV